MIRITVELVPKGIESSKRTLASGEIFNTGRGTKDHGIYGFRLFGKSGQVMREGALGAFFRVKFSVWWLIAAVLKVAFEDAEKAFANSIIEGGLVNRNGEKLSEQKQQA